MTGRRRAALVPAGLAIALVLGSGVAGYVYSHEPARDALLVEYEGDAPPQPEYATGAIVGIEDGVEGTLLRLDAAAGGQREVQVPADTPVEALRRTGSGPADGVAVNVGVDDTSFGQVLTGIVTIAEAP